MRKSFIAIVAVVALLFLTSCSNDITKGQVTNNAHIFTQANIYSEGNTHISLTINSYNIDGSSIYIDGYTIQSNEDGSKTQTRYEILTDLSNVVLITVDGPITDQTTMTETNAP